MNVQLSYGNATGKELRIYHDIIMAAIARGGEFDEDFSDIFTLTKTPEGSRVAYVLDWYPGE